MDIFIKENDKGKFAFVTFDTQDEANKALECNGTDVKGKAIRVNFAKPRGPKGQDRTDNANTDRKPRACFKCNQEGHFSRECPNADANNDRRAPRRENNHMPRNRQNGTGRQGPPKELVGKDFIWNPFTGQHDYLFGSKGSRKDFFCGSEVSSEVTETHRKSNGF